MNEIDAQQLSHPELLSELTLCEILKNSCIDVPDLRALSKQELIEIFKRIALPMPQRKYDDSRSLGKALNSLRVKRGIKTGVYEDTLPPSASPLANSINKNSVSDDSWDESRAPEDDDHVTCKKVCLSNSYNPEKPSEKETKRKNEISSYTDVKKRQKITWP